jgi:hypothetical protein
LFKTRKTGQKTQLSPLLLIWGGLAAVAVAAFAVAIFLSAGAGERPYVGGDFHSLAVDPKNPDRLVAGGHGGGALSTDGGKTWRQLGAIPGGMATWVSQDPNNPDTFYAAGGAVFKSTDGGESWRPSGEGLPEGKLPEGIWMVAVSPGDPQVVYAGALEGTQARLFRSEDGGESWEAQN